MVGNQKNEYRIVIDKHNGVKWLVIDVYQKRYNVRPKKERIAEAQHFLDCKDGATRVAILGENEIGIERPLRNEASAVWLEENIRDIHDYDWVNHHNMASIEGEVQIIDLPVSHVNHPKGKIQLLDGRELQCYETGQHGRLYDVENELDLDTLFRNIRKVKDLDRRFALFDEREADGDLFIANAFNLFDNSERILNDSRMFLCPVMSLGWLSFTQATGFCHPTLGVYIEWWKNCAKSRVKNDKGREWLVYNIIGNPLSDNNQCAMVGRDGRIKDIRIKPFKDLWQPFMEINTRYDSIKSRYDSYSLTEVLTLLKKDGARIRHPKPKKPRFTLQMVNYGQF